MYGLRGDTGHAILAAALAAGFLYMRFSTRDGVVSAPFTFVGSMADASLWFLLLSLLRGRWYLLAAAANLVIQTLLCANIIYFRTFGDLIPSSAYFHSQLSDPTVVSGSLAAFHTTDLILPAAALAPVVYALYNILRHRNFTNMSRRALAMAGAAAALCWGVWLAGAWRRTALNYDLHSPREIAESLFSGDSIEWKLYCRKFNFTGYAIRCLADICAGSHISLSEAQKTELTAFLEYRAARPDPPYPEATEPPRNLVIVVVESLPSKALQLEWAPEIAPVLHALSADSASLHADCRVLAGYGRSSDAQFMLNTGLLPLRDEPLVSRYATADYPSIAKATGLNSVEFIGENKSLWSHALTSRSYGFNRLIDRIAEHGQDRDSIIFARAARELDTIGTAPFFLFICSISMHDPYADEAVTGVSAAARAAIAASSTDARDREYLTRLHHFDSSLGRFVRTLKERHLYDSTLLVVTGDHEIRRSTVSPLLHDDRVPLLIAGATAVKAAKAAMNTEKNHAEAPAPIQATQLDIFPTILYLMQRTARCAGLPYKGLGRNILALPAREGPGSPPEAPLPPEEAYRASEYIIRGR